jgi:hypothetical protein
LGRQNIKLRNSPTSGNPALHARLVLSDRTIEHNIERRQTDGLITIFGAGRLNLFVGLINRFGVESQGLTASGAIAERIAGLI